MDGFDPGGTDGDTEAGHLELTPDAPDRRYRRRTDRAVLLALATVTTVLAGVVATVGLRDSGDDTDTTPHHADFVEDPVDSGDAFAPIGVAAPHDGVDSIGLPVTATPDIDLVDAQTIEVTASGFPAGAQVGIVQCSPHLAPLEGVARCMTSSFESAFADAEGAVHTTVVVHRTIVASGTEIDCAAPPPDDAPTSCTVAVGMLSDYDVSGTAPIHFDPDGPVAPRSSLEVIPATDLGDLQVVTVTIRDPGPGSHWSAMQCVAQEDPSRCTPLGAIGGTDPWSPFTTGDGTEVEVEVAVSRFVDEFDCATTPETCSLVVQGGAYGRMHSQRLTFDPQSMRPEATLSVLGSLPLVEHQPTEVAVGGRPPHWHHPGIVQCPAGETEVWSCYHVEAAVRSADGSGTVVEIHPVVTVWTHDGSPVDCREPGACVLRVLDPGGRVAAEAPIEVAPDHPAP